MNVLTLSDGVQVRCHFCGETHQIEGYQGNNIHWEDANGWSGSFDVAHAAFDSKREAYSICPTCLSLETEDRQKLIERRVDSMLAAQRR